MNAPRHGHTDRGGGAGLLIGCVAFAVLLFSMALGVAFFMLRTGPSGIPPISPTPASYPPPSSLPVPAAPEPVPAAPAVPVPLEASPTAPSEREAPAVIRPEATEVTGSLAPDVIQRVIRRHVTEVRHCYDVGLSSDPNLSGRITISFVIGVTGTVSTARVTASTFPPSRTSVSVGECITAAVGRWMFPAPDGGSVTVNYPFVLNPG